LDQISRLVGEALEHRLLHGIGGEGQRPREHVEEHQAQRIDVAPAIQLVARELLGAQELGRADHQAGSRHLLAAPLPANGFGKAEIDHLHRVRPVATARQHDVVGLQVAVHDAEVVCGLECGCHLDADVRGARDGQRSFAREQLRERLALDELHRQVDQPVRGLTEIVDGTDVGVRDAARVRGLAVEAGDGLRVVYHGGVHHLDGTPAPHLHVLGEVHLAHSSLAQLFHNVIAVGQDLAHEIVRRPRRAQGLPVARTESYVVAILRRTDGADLHAGISIRSSLSPTRMRDWSRSAMSPRAASAMPLRLLASTTTKSASSERTTAWRALIDGSYGNTQSTCSRPMATSRPGESWITSRTLPSDRSWVRLAMSALGMRLPIRFVASASGGCGPGYPSRRNRIICEPMSNVSPSSRRYAPSRNTHVPLRLPRSRTTRLSCSHESLACNGDRNTSSGKRMSPSSRPMVVSGVLRSKRCTALPRSSSSRSAIVAPA